MHRPVLLLTSVLLAACANLSGGGVFNHEDEATAANVDSRSLATYLGIMEALATENSLRQAAIFSTLSDTLQMESSGRFIREKVLKLQQSPRII